MPSTYPERPVRPRLWMSVAARGVAHVVPARHAFRARHAYLPRRAQPAPDAPIQNQATDRDRDQATDRDQAAGRSRRVVIIAAADDRSAGKTSRARSWRWSGVKSMSDETREAWLTAIICVLGGVGAVVGAGECLHDIGRGASNALTPCLAFCLVVRVWCNPKRASSAATTTLATEEASTRSRGEMLLGRGCHTPRPRAPIGRRRSDAGSGAKTACSTPSTSCVPREPCGVRLGRVGQTSRGSPGGRAPGWDPAEHPRPRKVRAFRRDVKLTMEGKRHDVVGAG